MKKSESTSGSGSAASPKVDYSDFRLPLACSDRDAKDFTVATPLEVRDVEWNETNDLGERKVVPHETMLEFKELLDSLPRLSVTEDMRRVLERVYELARCFTPIRITLGDRLGACNRILNSILLKRSHGDVSLQGILLKLVDVITQDKDMARKVIQKSDYIIPFLVGCLSSRGVDNRDNAANRVRDLAELDSGFSRKIREPLIHNIIEGDQMGVTEAITAMLELCLELENRELGDSNGVTTAAMEKVVRRVRVEETLQTFEMLCKHEKAIVEMEKYGILKSLSEILGEDVGERAKGYCVDIIHTMCHASSAINTRRQIKDVENARQTLELLVRVGTKANEVLLKLQEWANEESS